MVRALIITCALTSIWLSSSAAMAQNFVTGPFKGCPDATEDEAKMFKIVPVPQPRIEERDRMYMEGNDARLLGHKTETFALIPKAWQSTLQALPSISNVVRPTTPLANGEQPDPTVYAVCHGSGQEAGEFHFIPSVEVTDTANLPANFTGIELESHTYAVFPYQGSIDGTGDFRYSVAEYLKASSYKRLDAPNFEAYSDLDKAVSSEIEMEFWVPIQKPN